MGAYNILDLFCGTGGFSSGFTSADDRFKVVAAIDIFGVAAQTMKANHQDCLVYDLDIRTISPERVEEDLKKHRRSVQIIVGGPPCQGFSSIRPHRGENKDDPRNTLFMQFAKYVDHFRPIAFVFENVVGLVTHNDGTTLQMIQDSFHKLGYATEWRILNTANYGVPQKRERLIMIGVPAGEKIVFPAATHSFNGKTIGVRDREKMLSPTDELPKALTVMEAIGDLPPVASGQEATSYSQPPLNEFQTERRKGCSELTLHQATNHPPAMLEIIKHSGDSIRCIPKHLITSGFSSCYSRLDPNEPSVTITVKFTNPASNRCIHPYQDRALTPREGARIQGFDDSYVFCGSRTQVTSQIGNAVPPLLGKAIAKSLLKML